MGDILFALPFFAGIAFVVLLIWASAAGVGALRAFLGGMLGLVLGFFLGFTGDGWGILVLWLMLCPLFLFLGAFIGMATGKGRRRESPAAIPPFLNPGDLTFFSQNPAAAFLPVAAADSGPLQKWSGNAAWIWGFCPGYGRGNILRGKNYSRQKMRLWHHWGALP